MTDHPIRSLWVGIVAAFLCAGCAGYRMGTRSLYAPDISTVYVPMIESDSFRDLLGERLTEAVTKEILLKTPYKVVGDPTGDSILSARIVKDSKRVLVENGFDEPRETEVSLSVRVRWIDRHGGLLRQPQSISLSPEVVRIGQSATLVPEAGQSIATAQQKVIQQLAEQIVATMEVPW